MAKLRMVCATCGGTNVLRDAWAVWCEDAQEWELGPVFDDAHCNDCDGETRIEEKEVQ